MLGIIYIELGVKSHPSRVRGLKREGRVRPRQGHPSHPSRVRGLKHHDEAVAPCADMSHPSRVRGLKLAPLIDVVADIQVAPFAGAWIETRRRTPTCRGSVVAPFAGAWIETHTC